VTHEKIERPPRFKGPGAATLTRNQSRSWDREAEDTDRVGLVTHERRVAIEGSKAGQEKNHCERSYDAVRSSCTLWHKLRIGRLTGVSGTGGNRCHGAQITSGESNGPIRILPNLISPDDCHDPEIDPRWPGVAGNRIASVGTDAGEHESAELVKVVAQHAASFKRCLAQV
jgi:hypothetical protein